MFEICLAIYLLLGFVLAFLSRDQDDRRILLAHPLVGIIIAMSWPAVIVMVIPRAESFKFRGKTIWERKPKFPRP